MLNIQSPNPDNVQWNAFSQNCTDMAIIIGEEAGVETQPHDGYVNTPMSLWEYLYELLYE